MKFKRYIAFLIMSASLSVLYAQKTKEKHSVSVGWGVWIPVGTSTFANKLTWVTPHVGYEYRLLPQLSAGFSVGCLYSNEKGDTTDRYDNSLVSGNSHRKLTAVPIQAELLYFPLGSREQLVQPFLGIGGGVRYAKFYITGDVINTSQVSSWAGVMTPQVGLRVTPFANKKISLDARLYWQNAANRWELLDTSSQQGIGIELRMVSLVF